MSTRNIGKRTVHGPPFSWCWSKACRAGFPNVAPVWSILFVVQCYVPALCGNAASLFLTTKKKTVFVSALTPVIFWTQVYFQMFCSCEEKKWLCTDTFTSFIYIFSILKVYYCYYYETVSKFVFYKDVFFFLNSEYIIGN